MRIQKLIIKEIEQIYKEQMPFDFPASEIKPLNRVISLVEKELYEGYGLFREEKLIGYAFFAKAQESKWKLLDYFAICSPYRADGNGSLFLSLLKQELQKNDVEAIIIEIESIRSAKNEEEKHIRTKRRGFYKKNEIQSSERYANIFGVEFEILYYFFTDKAKKENIIEEYRSIYQSMVPDKLYQEHCKIEDTTI